MNVSNIITLAQVDPKNLYIFDLEVSAPYKKFFLSGRAFVLFSALKRPQAACSVFHSHRQISTTLPCYKYNGILERSFPVSELVVLLSFPVSY
jgi:hypothetical protein